MYSSRQVDDKYISKARHNSHLKSSSRESSPYRASGKTSSSPSGRKRAYNSPNSASKVSNSPYDSIRKKDRIDNVMGKNECQNSVDPRTESKVDDIVIKRVQCRRCPINGLIKDGNDWSEHLSSSGKIYYYNKRTEESQWEVPKGWNDRDPESKDALQKERSSRGSLNISKESSSRDDFREVRDPREIKDYKYKEKIIAKDYCLEDSRSYRDPRKNREKDPRESCDNFKDRDYRDRGSRDYDGKHRFTPGSSKRDLKYTSPSVRTSGQSTPSSSTSHTRPYRRPAPDSLNGSGSGSVQDISPPGTPTNDDIANMSTMSTMSPAPLYTSHSCSPLLTTAISTPSRLPLPTTLHTPRLSPIIHNTSTHISTPYLHPLQQALLLQQQQTTTVKDVFGSPKLPTVKNNLPEVTTTPPTSSPRTFSNRRTVPMVQSPDLTDRSATPPPPPPPLKDHNRLTDTKDRTPKPERQITQTPPTTHESRSEQYENMNRSKTPEIQPGDTTPVKSAYKPFNTERLIKRTIKLDKEEHILFPPLPDLDKYSEFFSPSVADFNTSFYCNTLESQIALSWEETMNLLHTDGYRSKLNLAICQQNVDCQDSKLEVSSGWVDALNAVIQKVESLQDSSMKSEARVATRDTKSSATRKNKGETNSESSGENCEKNDTNDTESNTTEQDATSATVIKPSIIIQSVDLEVTIDKSSVIDKTSR